MHHTMPIPPNYTQCIIFIYLFIWGFYVAFNTVQVISRRVVGRAEYTQCIIQCEYHQTVHNASYNANTTKLYTMHHTMPMPLNYTE